MLHPLRPGQAPIKAAIAAILLIFFATAGVAHAADPTPLQRAERAHDAGDFKTCQDAAKAGLADGDSHDLRFFKARCAYKLKHVDAAWQEFQKVHPGKLHARYQDAFVSEYEAAEKTFKKEKQTEADVAALVAQQAREDASARRRNLLIAGGVGLLGGGVLLYLGIDQAAEADKLDITIPEQKTEQEQLRSTATILQAGGIGLAAIGVGVCIWALVDDAGPTAAAWSVRPTIAARGDRPGLLFEARF